MATLTQEQRKKVEEMLAQTKQMASRLQTFKGTLTKEELEKPISQKITPPTAEPIRPLPSLPPTPSAGGKSSLVEFADVLGQITDLAKKKRQRLATETLIGAGFVPGVAEPGTFASILHNVERATQTGVEESLKTAKELLPKELTGDLKEFEDAKRLGIVPKDTDFFEFIKKKKEVTREPFTKAEKRDVNVSQFLTSKKGTDGFVDAFSYQEALRKFISGGGTQTNFFASFPQQTYLRRKEIEKLPPALKPQQIISKGDLTPDQLSIINDAKARIDTARQRFEPIDQIREAIIQRSIQQFGFDPSPYF